MKRNRHTPKEIINKLREAATLLVGGQSVEAVRKKLEVRPPTYHQWRQQDGGAKEETIKRLKALGEENTQCKRLVVDLSLDNAILKELWAEPSGARQASAGSPAGPHNHVWRYNSACRAGGAGMELVARVQDALHQARQTVAERLQRELQQPVPGRVPQP